MTEPDIKTAREWGWQPLDFAELSNDELKHIADYCNDHTRRCKDRAIIFHAMIFQYELRASIHALENGEDPQRVAAQMRHTLRLVGRSQA